MADMPPGMNPLDELEPIKFIPIGKKNHPTADGLDDQQDRDRHGDNREQVHHGAMVAVHDSIE